MMKKIIECGLAIIFLVSIILFSTLVVEGICNMFASKTPGLRGIIFIIFYPTSVISLSYLGCKLAEKNVQA